MANEWVGERRHPLFLANQQRWQRFTDIFDGGEAMRKYIVAHAKEKDVSKRRERALYENHPSGIIHDLTAFIVNESNPITRSEGEWTEFFENVDGMGSTIDEFMSAVAIAAAVTGVEWIAVDAPNTGDIPQIMSKAQLKDSGLSPYYHHISPLNVVDWIEERGRIRAVKIAITPPDERTDLSQDYNADEEVYFTWDEAEWKIWRQRDKGWVATKTGKNHVGWVPVTPMAWIQGETPAVGVSALKEVGPVAVEMLNLESQLQQLLFDQAYAQTIVNADPNDVKNLDWGADRVICIPPSPEGIGFQPYMLTVEPSWADHFEARLERFERIQYKLGRTMTQWDATQSGVSKQWDFHHTNAALSRASQNLEQGERWLHKTMARWIKPGVDPEMGRDFPEVRYPRDFYVRDEKDDLAEVSDLQSLRFPPTAIRYAKQMVINRLMDANPAERQKALDELNSSMEGESILDIEDTSPQESPEDFQQEE